MNYPFALLEGDLTPEERKFVAFFANRNMQILAESYSEQPTPRIQGSIEFFRTISEFHDTKAFKEALEDVQQGAADAEAEGDALFWERLLGQQSAIETALLNLLAWRVKFQTITLAAEDVMNTSVIPYHTKVVIEYLVTNRYGIV